MSTSDPYSPNLFLGWDFFPASYSKTTLVNFLMIKKQFPIFGPYIMEDEVFGGYKGGAMMTLLVDQSVCSIE